MTQEYHFGLDAGLKKRSESLVRRQKSTTDIKDSFLINIFHKAIVISMLIIHSQNMYQ
jgi:hypothetical protein